MLATVLHVLFAMTAPAGCDMNAKSCMGNCPRTYRHVFTSSQL